MPVGNHAIEIISKFKIVKIFQNFTNAVNLVNCEQNAKCNNKVNNKFLSTAK